MGDIPLLCNLLADLFSIENDFTPSADKQRRGLELLIQNADTGLSIVLVALREKRIVGMCSVQTVISTAEGGPAGIMEDLVVHHEHRWQGIGGCLVGAAMAWCTNKGILRLQLLADKDNFPALQFYFSRGWTRTGLVCLRKHL